MKAVTNLPEGYEEIYVVDLQKDKKIALLINGIAIVIAVLMIVPACFYVPVTSLFDMSEGIGEYFLRFGVLMGAMVLYMVLHELVHGITMKLCGTKKVKYGFTGMYAFAGSDDYYDRSGYITIALAPVILWGVVLVVINCFVPTEWFWVVYFVQISNLSGAAGDLFVTVRFSRMPADILVKDSGVAMRVFSKKNG